ncbi:hypothetical protein C7I85_25525 [Mesorhizobium soli]|uniref:Uncharacterized protein n=1 Tax=Pseudaminobacter soli (ex Li et al. 2025) TaxID=1295366 RepID=A0A2P7S0W2_9HYPH|nr:hypothetical protein C7I85_25525 [Mesorhizobium soli]
MPLCAPRSQTIAGEPPKKGGFLVALRRSPLAGSYLTRPDEEGRKVEFDTVPVSNITDFAPPESLL